MLVFRIVSDSTDGNLMSYNRGVERTSTTEEGANRTKRHSLWVVARGDGNGS